MTSVFEKTFEKTRANAEKEAAKVAVEVEEVQLIDLQQEGDPGSLRAAFTTALSGRSKPRQIQVYRLRKGAQPFLYVQPFDNNILHPAEFHARVSGGLPDPICYHSQGFKNKWLTNDNPSLLERLEGMPSLKAVQRKLSWVKTSGGNLKIGLDWAIQARSIGDGAAHVVMQAGSYGGLFSDVPGIAVFLELLEALQPALVDPSTTPQNLYYNCYWSLFNQFAFGD